MPVPPKRVVLIGISPVVGLLCRLVDPRLGSAIQRYRQLSQRISLLVPSLISYVPMLQDELRVPVRENVPRKDQEPQLALVDHEDVWVQVCAPISQPTSGLSRQPLET